MVDPSAVLAAKQLLRKSRSSPGVSNVAPIYSDWGAFSGASGSYANALPRPSQDFTDATFGPLTPIKPMGINDPGENFDRPQPRRWQYPVGWDMPVGQPGSEGFKLANFGTLRTLGNLYSVARSCIRLRINELRGMYWDITPTKEAEKAMRGDSKAHKDFQERRMQAMKFFKRPDPDYHDFSSWLAACLEEVFVIDALSLYLQPTKGAKTSWGKGKGLLGSDLAHLCLIDGATVRPLVDVYGATPRPPSVAYQVYEYGVPRVDLMTLVTGEDRDEIGEKPVAEYRGDQLLYLPYNPQRWTPYGFTPIEGAIVPVIAGLRKQQWQSNYFDEGTVPRAFISPGDPSITPGQIQELQAALNAIAGDVAWHHKIIVLPSGSTVNPMVNTELADQYDEIVMTQVCMGFDVMPMELGISPKVSSTQSSGAANQMAKASESVNQRKSLKPFMLWLKTCIFDKILQDVCGQVDMEWRWEALVEGEDEEALIGMLIEQIKLGLMSIDEARSELGRQPWGLPITSDPGVLLGTGYVPLGAIDPNTGAPAATQPALPGEAGVPQPSTPVAGEPVAGGTPASSAPSSGKPKPAPAQTPGHTGGTAGTAQSAAQTSTGGTAPPVRAKPQPGTPRGPVESGGSKAALSELDALRRHLNKGRDIRTWDTRHLSPQVISKVEEALSQNHGVDRAISIARAHLDSSEPESEGEQVGLKGSHPKWPGWSVDLELSSEFSRELITSLSGVLSAAQAYHIAEEWLAVATPGKNAEQWLQITYPQLSRVIVTALSRTLRRIWRRGWALGEHSARALVRQHSAASKASSDDDVSSASVIDEQALREWLNTAGITGITGIADTRMSDLADILSTAVEEGQSAGQLATAIEAIGTDEVAADLVAGTELARAVSQASLNTYDDFGVTEVSWLTAPTDVCPICQDNATAGDVPLGTAFPSGHDAPPAHPRCRCVLQPSVMGGLSIDIGSIAQSVAAL